MAALQKAPHLDIPPVEKPHLFMGLFNIFQYFKMRLYEVYSRKEQLIMLHRNLNPKKGLCNGARLAVKEYHRSAIIAEVLSESNG